MYRSKRITTGAVAKKAILYYYFIQGNFFIFFTNISQTFFLLSETSSIAARNIYSYYSFWQGSCGIQTLNTRINNSKDGHAFKRRWYPRPSPQQKLLRSSFSLSLFFSMCQVLSVADASEAIAKA
jgi:hypothetical protein